MKNSIFYMAALAAALIIASCGSKATSAAEADAIANASYGSVNYNVNVAKSEILWKGSKAVGIGEHQGAISLTEGTLHVENGNLTAGNFTLDMNSIRNTDLADAAQKGMLEGHLKADDFFNVAKYPTGKFAISKVEAKADGENTHLISGNLTLRDVTKNITFPAKIDINDAGLVATANVTIDRLDWGINYDKEKMSLSEAAQQTAKNGIVSKDVSLTIKIQATP
jgi:polyisoprenoid-binding protein YceI